MAKYFVGLVFVAAIAGCSIHLDSPEYTPENRPRQVLDADTQHPVGDAYVIFNWWETRANLAGGQSHCVRAEFRMTDPLGRFEIPSWRGAHPTLVDVYKPGMVHVGARRDKSGVEQVRKSQANGAQRYEEMSRTSGRLLCEDGGRDMLPVRQALLDEALAIRTPQTTQKMIDAYEIARDAAKYGRDEANRLYDERLKARKPGGLQ